MFENINSQLSQLETRLEEGIAEVTKEEDRVEKVEKKNRSKSTVVTFLAWLFVVVGLGIGVHGIVEANDWYVPLSLNELGDYLGGTVASLWALAGVLFIYVSFLGQQTELSYTRLEQKRSRLQLLYNQKEVLTQKWLIDQQIRGIKEEVLHNDILFLIKTIDDDIRALNISNLTGSKAVSRYIHDIDSYLDGEKGLDNIETQFHFRSLIHILDKVKKVLMIIESSGLPYQRYIDLVEGGIEHHLQYIIRCWVEFGKWDDLKDFITEVGLFKSSDFASLPDLLQKKP